MLRGILGVMETGELKMLPIADMPGYMACEDGTIWSFTNWRGLGPRTLSGSEDKHGYLKVHTRIGEKRIGRHVHRLVCTAFYGPKPNRLHQVRHLNGVRTDNRVCNLQWGTAKENAADRDAHGKTFRGMKNGYSKITDEEASAIVVFSKRGMPSAIMAAYLGVSRETVTNIASGRRWSP